MIKLKLTQRGRTLSETVIPKSIIEGHSVEGIKHYAMAKHSDLKFQAIKERIEKGRGLDFGGVDPTVYDVLLNKFQPELNSGARPITQLQRGLLENAQRPTTFIQDDRRAQYEEKFYNTFLEWLGWK